MKAGAVLIGRYYRLRAVSAVLGLLLMTSAAAAVVFMGMLWPAFRYHHTGSADAARWDVHVNGPLAQSDVDALLGAAAESGARRVEFANRGAIKRLSAGGRVVHDAGDLYALSPSGEADFELTWAAAPLVVSGAMRGQNAAGVDWVTARRLGVGVGDSVSFTQVYAGPDGALRMQRGTARLSAVLATTSDMRGLVVRSSPELQSVVEHTVGVVATDAFFESSDPAGLEARLAALPGAEDRTITTRSVYQRSARASAHHAGARAYGSTGLLVAAGLLFVAVLRDLLVRLARRRSSLAVLYSLGQRTGGILGVHLLEQSAIVGVVSSAGYLLGIELLVSQVGLYPPRDSRTTLCAAWLLCVAVLAVVCLSMVRRRITERSLIASAAEWRS